MHPETSPTTSVPAVVEAASDVPISPRYTDVEAVALVMDRGGCCKGGRGSSPSHSPPVTGRSQAFTHLSLVNQPP